MAVVAGDHEMGAIPNAEFFQPGYDGTYDSIDPLVSVNCPLMVWPVSVGCCIHAQERKKDEPGQVAGVAIETSNETIERKLVHEVRSLKVVGQEHERPGHSVEAV